MATLLLHSSCKKDEEAKSGLNGTMEVEGGTPDGVTVMLFDDPTLGFDATTVWHTTASEPGVGFPYEPLAAFDWRKEMGSHGTFAASTTSGADGKFNIPEQEEGRYILVAEKEGYGWTAPIEVNLNEPTVDVGTLRLYQDQPLPPITNGNLTLLSDHHYYLPFLSGELFVRDGDTLRVEAGAVIRGDDGTEIRVAGNMICEGTPEKWVVLTSDWDTRLQSDDWEGVRFTDDDTGSSDFGRFSYTSFQYCASGAYSSAQHLTLDHCYFANTGSYGYAVDCSSGRLAITRSVFNNVPNGARASRSDSLRIENNIFQSARQNAITAEYGDSGLINCNWFHNCGRDTITPGATGVITLLHVSHYEITHNHTQESWHALNVFSGVDSTNHIRFNKYDQINLLMNIEATAGGATPSFPTFQYNCMTVIDQGHIFLNSPDRNTEDIDARFNYWGTANAAEIPGYINDFYDDPELPIVHWDGYLLSCPSDNGICPF